MPPMGEDGSAVEVMCKRRMFAAKFRYRQMPTYIPPEATPGNAIAGIERTVTGCLAIKVPANGYLTQGIESSGWECEWGYHATGDQCVAVVIPEHAYLTDTSNGQSWKCLRGYRLQIDQCAAIEVPTPRLFIRFGLWFRLGM